MHVLVLHNEPAGDASVDEADVIAQRDAVLVALRQLGHRTTTIACTLDLHELRRRLEDAGPDLVFNLVESLGGTDRLMPLATLMLDALQLRYTGASTESILATSNKLAAKRRLRTADLPTPAWDDLISELPVQNDSATQPPTRWIIKPVWEHASIGMDDDAVIQVADVNSLRRQARLRQQRLDRPMFAEEFIDGREFNLSMLAGEVLPPAEIDFSEFPQSKPRIVGHRAKWEESSFEYQKTPRLFDFSSGDQPLLTQLNDLAVECWRLFQLRGFARVDMRVDPHGRPWILEVNVNPCLSPDAGFAAALARASISCDRAIERIVEDALTSPA